MHHAIVTAFALLGAFQPSMFMVSAQKPVYAHFMVSTSLTSKPW